MSEINDLADWKIKNGDLVFSEGDIGLVTGKEVVAQDIESRLKERGSIYQLINAETADIPSVLIAITLEIEEDTRIKPGTAELDFSYNNDELTVDYTAQLNRGGTITGEINA